MRMDTVAKFGSACAAMLLPVLVEAAQNGAVDAETGAYVVKVAAGTDVTLSAEDAAALGTGVDLVKRGAGRLVIATNLKAQGWAGELRVEEGYLRAREVGALGTAAKGTVVSDGATFEVDGSAVGVNTSGFVSGEPFTITGRGMKEGGEEMGVIRNVANSQYPGISPVTMHGDCLYTGVEANGRLDVREGTLDMNGHTLTVRGYFALTTAALAHPGHIAVESGKLCLEGGLTFNGGAENRLTVASGARVILQGAKGNLPWTLVLRDGAKVERLTYGSDEAGRNVWAGPVELVSGQATLVSSETKLPPLTFTGNITGAGGLNVTSTGNGVVRLMGAANTFTGGLTVSGGGEVWLESPGALPHGEGAGDIRLDHKDARLLARARDDAGTVETGWSVAEYRVLADKVQVVREGAAALLWNAAGETTTYDEAVSTDGFLGHAGAGTLRLGGDWATGDLMNLEGNLDVAEGAQLHLRFLDLAGGTMTVPGGALVYCHTNAYMGCAWPETAKLVVESGGCFMTSNESPTRVYSMDMGHPRYRRDASYRAVLELQDGASMTGRICVGTGMGRTDAAALYIRAGARFRSGGTGGGSDMNIGSDGNGYVEMAGWMQMPGWTVIGGGGNGRGVWVQKGGEAANTSDTFAIGSGGGRGEAYFSGGTFTADRGHPGRARRVELEGLRGACGADGDGRRGRRLQGGHRPCDAVEQRGRAQPQRRRPAGEVYPEDGAGHAAQLRAEGRRGELCCRAVRGQYGLRKLQRRHAQGASVRHALQADGRRRRAPGRRGVCLSGRGRLRHGGVRLHDRRAARRAHRTGHRVDPAAGALHRAGELYRFALRHDLRRWDERLGARGLRFRARRRDGHRGDVPGRGLHVGQGDARARRLDERNRAGGPAAGGERLRRPREEGRGAARPERREHLCGARGGGGRHARRGERPRAAGGLRARADGRHIRRRREDVHVRRGHGDERRRRERVGCVHGGVVHQDGPGRLRP